MVYDKRGTETKPRNDRNYGEHTDRSQQVKKTINGNDLHELLFVRSHLQFLYDHKMITKKTNGRCAKQYSTGDEQEVSTK